MRDEQNKDLNLWMRKEISNLKTIKYLDPRSIEIIDKHFNEWHKYGGKSDKGKKHKVVKLSNLQRKKKVRCTLPSLKDYILHIEQQFFWCNSDYQARWKENEGSILG